VQITASAVSLNVEDVVASSAFLTEHFGFREVMDWAARPGNQAPRATGPAAL
jgi:catechol 2,3-dioxygenase-like lactoylglutathione lyase family enzyme